MKKYLLIFIFCLGYEVMFYARETENNSLCISLCTGYGMYSSFDKLLNHYIYKGYTAFPIQLKSSFQKNKNFFTLSINTNLARINPGNNYNLYYEYNYIKHQQNTLSLKYYRELAQIKDNLCVCLGVAYNLDLVVQQENYKSLLYEYGTGHRKSYTLSIFSLSSNVLLSYLLCDKNILSIEASYSPFSYSARPNDDYVKQLKLNDEKAQWKFFSIKEYTTFQFAFTYKRRITHNLDIVFEFNTQYQAYSYLDECRYMKKLLLIGIAKSF